MGEMMAPMYQPPNFYPYSNDIFFPVGNHPLYAPFSSTVSSSQADIRGDLSDRYNSLQAELNTGRERLTSCLTP